MNYWLVQFGVSQNQSSHKQVAGSDNQIILLTGNGIPKRHAVGTAWRRIAHLVRQHMVERIRSTVAQIRMSAQAPRLVLRFEERISSHHG